MFQHNVNVDTYTDLNLAGMKWKLIYWAGGHTQQSTWVEQMIQSEKSKKYQPIRGLGGHLVFPIAPKNTNFVEEFEILLPVKFR